MNDHFPWQYIVVPFFALMVACGGSSGTASSGGDSGTGGSGGTSGTAFTVSGTLSDTTVGTSLSKSVSGTATHIMAVSPTVGGVSCKQAAVGSGGTFSLELTGLNPWLLYFYDSSKIGSNMFMGRIFSSSWDAFTPASTTGSADLGTVTIDADTGKASSSSSHSDIMSAFGMTSALSGFMGGLDDAIRRYSNPDTDGDGSADCDTSSDTNKFVLDFHVRFDMKLNGTKATIANIIDSYLDDTTTTSSYNSTGIYVAYPTSFSSATTGSVKFQDAAVTTSEGGSIAQNTATSDVTQNSFSGYYGFGPNTTSTSELPTGTIIFTAGSKTLTFSDVQAPSLAELTAPTGRIFPFIKFVKSDSSCATSCTIASVDYKWMEKTATGWTLATTDELAILVAGDGATISIRVDNNSNTTFNITIPKTSASGSITWTSSNATLSGVTASQFNALTTTQLCHLGLSYDDKIGMRYFQNIDDAAGTCS